MLHLAAAILLAMSASGVRAQVAALPEAIRDVRWNVSSTVFGDFTCRGYQDMALFGRSEISELVVMIQPSHGGAETSYLIIPLRGRDSNKLRLVVESLDLAHDKKYEQEVRSVAPGLRSSKSCKGIVLTDQETDANHIYWNRDKKVFQWWSL